MSERMEFAGEGLRQRVALLDGEDVYLLVVIDNGIPAIQATVPHENTEELAHMRRVVETVCATANQMMLNLMGGSDGENVYRQQAAQGCGRH